MTETKTTAIILAAGQGKRMQSKIQKQYILLKGYPVLYYAIKEFENSFINDIVLVVGKGEEEYCRHEIVEKYGFTKIRAVIEGGKERYHSVANGLQAIDWECQYVFIHDGARPFINQDILQRGLDSVKEFKACVVGMPVKDTVKIVDADSFVQNTPKRAEVWQVQTPQVFVMPEIRKLYEKLIINENELLNSGIAITDDAMVWELYDDRKVKLVEGSYKNIKITTQEDLKIAEAFLQKKSDWLEAAKTYNSAK